MTRGKIFTGHKKANASLNYLIVSNDGLSRGFMSFAYFNKRLKKLKLLNRLKVRVTGIIKSKGVPPDPMAVKTLKKEDIPLNSFQLEPLSEDLLRKVDVMITLSRENYNYLRNTYPSLPPKVRILNVPVILAKKEDSYVKAFRKIAAGLDQEFLSLQLRPTSR